MEPAIRELTVLYDADCGVCRTVKHWLERRPKYVPMVFIPAGSAEARARFPGLDHAATLQEVTVVADNGDVYSDDAAWLICLWAVRSHRRLALRLAQPHLRPYVRQMVNAAASVRRRSRYGRWGESPWSPEECADGRCEPAAVQQR